MVSGDHPRLRFGAAPGASMRLPTLSLLLISAVLLGEIHGALAQSPTSYPWCSRSDDGNYNSCYFTSKEQCRGTSGTGALCFANPRYRPSSPASDVAVNVPPSPGIERNQLPREPARQVGARQSPVVQAKQSASTGERSPGGRLDASAAGAQGPKEETRSLPSNDDLWPMSGSSTVHSGGSWASWWRRLVNN
jgi:Protein of unknown function (DUF3551)